MVKVFERILYYCYIPFQNYGMAILLFTLLSKIILFPLSIWVQKNSIKMVKIQPKLNEISLKYYGDRDAIAERQMELMKKEKYNSFASILPMVIQIILLIVMIAAIKNGMETEGTNLKFCGFLLDAVPYQERRNTIVIPIVAGLTAYLLCVVQNKVNVLQENSSKALQYGTMVCSVGISLWLGFYVQIGVALYWMASNLFSIVVTLLVNLIMNPKKYVDYEELKRTQDELNRMAELSKKNVSRADKIREKKDYKKFFSIENKKLVFYSESGGFYKYFQGIIEYIITNTNLQVHYITSDPKDSIFQIAEKEDQIHPYYIGNNRLITLMMKMDADIVIMTMPDLDNYHIKRSYVRKDVEYIFVPHALHSINLMMRTGCVDNFDTVFITGKHQEEEIRKTEEIYHLKKKNLVKCGYPLLDSMMSEYERETKAGENRKIVLIAPSWQDDGILDLCLEEMLDQLVDSDYKVIARPHPQDVRHRPEYMQYLKEKYKSQENIEIQLDFSSNDTVFNADVLITEWSGIAYEYAFTTLKPVLFIETPMKVHNPEYEKIGVVPMNIWMRKEIGEIVKLDKIGTIKDAIKECILKKDEYRDAIEKYRNEYIYNIGKSADVGADYIIGSLQEKISKRRNQK